MVEQAKSHSLRGLDEWLCYLESIHATEIDMGLERISNVAQRLNIDLSHSKVVTVAGTNGKGTTCAFIENALISQNHSVAVYSSPHIKRFNERLRINKLDISDQPLIDAFEAIEQARGEVSLTYYEFTTLAAFIILMAEQPEFIILEVGLGGRLDAVNIIDADIAVITTVDLDHQAFLGNDRESIGFEKAGIMRSNQSVVIGDSNIPQSVLSHANNLQVDLYARDAQFSIEVNNSVWLWKNEQQCFNNLPIAQIPRDNIATALMVLTLLDIKLAPHDCQSLISDTKVAGRTEIIQQNPFIVMLDVGHNPLAARYLSQVIEQNKAKKVHAVVAMLGDKDIKSTLEPLANQVDQWYIASLDVPRGASAQQVFGCLPKQVQSSQSVLSFDNVPDGYKMAITNAQCNDLVLVFGSFFTVAAVKAYLS